MKVALVAFLLTAALVASAGCGGGGNGEEDKTFEGDGYSFTYPVEWDEQDVEVPYEVGDEISSTYVGPGGADLLTVAVYRAPVSVTKDNIDEYEDDLSGVAQETFQENDGRLTAGPTPVTMDGLPGFRYEGSLVTGKGVRVQSRLSFVFDGGTEYFLNCQVTPERAEEMKRGCEQVEESFQVE